MKNIFVAALNFFLMSIMAEANVDAVRLNLTLKKILLKSGPELFENEIYIQIKSPFIYNFQYSNTDRIPFQRVVDGYVKKAKYFNVVENKPLIIDSNNEGYGEGSIFNPYKITEQNPLEIEVWEENSPQSDKKIASFTIDYNTVKNLGPGHQFHFEDEVVSLDFENDSVKHCFDFQMLRKLVINNSGAFFQTLPLLEHNKTVLIETRLKNYTVQFEYIPQFLNFAVNYNDNVTSTHCLKFYSLDPINKTGSIVAEYYGGVSLLDGSHLRQSYDIFTQGDPFGPLEVLWPENNNDDKSNITFRYRAWPENYEINHAIDQFVLQILNHGITSDLAKNLFTIARQELFKYSTIDLFSKIIDVSEFDQTALHSPKEKYAHLLKVIHAIYSEYPTQRKRIESVDRAIRALESDPSTIESITKDLKLEILER